MKTLTLTIALILGIFLNLPESDARSMMRWSLEPTAGVSIGHMDVATEPSLIYGGSLRFAISPVVSLQGTFYMGTFQDNGEDPSFRTFENDFYQYSLKTQLSLMQPFLLDGGAARFNPYLIAGIGQIQNNVSGVITDRTWGSGVEYDEADMVIIGGAGLKIKLSRVIDLFLQYEYNFTNSDLIDGYNLPVYLNRFNDSYSFATGGLAIKFGGRDIEHADWYKPEDKAQKTADENARRIRELNREIEELENQQEEVIKKEVEEMREEFERKIADLEAANEKIIEEVEKVRTEGPRPRAGNGAGTRTNGEVRDPSQPGQTRPTTATVKSIESGKYYIISGSFQRTQNAEALVAKYEGQGFSAFLIEYRERGLYRVVISAHDDEFEARDQLDSIRREVENTAWLFVP